MSERCECHECTQARRSSLERQGDPVRHMLYYLPDEWAEILRKLEEAGNTIRILDGQICGIPLK